MITYFTKAEVFSHINFFNVQIALMLLFRQTYNIFEYRVKIIVRHSG